VNTSDIICTIKTIEEKNICAEYIIRQSHNSTCMCPDLSGPKTTGTKTIGACVCVLNQNVIFHRLLSSSFCVLDLSVIVGYDDHYWRLKFFHRK
jgi:hypothetical protein